MGNALGGKRRAKVMKIDGEELKLKTPIKAGEVTKDYPGHVILDSEAVKHYGTRAKPLGSAHELKPSRLYFLVELPSTSPSSRMVTRRVRSAIHVSAKERLESLVLARRSASDLSNVIQNKSGESPEMGGGGGVRVKMRLPRSEVERVMRESRDRDEAAKNILHLYRNLNIHNKDNDHDIMPIINTSDDDDHRTSLTSITEEDGNVNKLHEQQPQHWNHNTPQYPTKKRVSFRPINEGEIQIAVA